MPDLRLDIWSILKRKTGVISIFRKPKRISRAFYLKGWKRYCKQTSQQELLLMHTFRFLQGSIQQRKGEVYLGLVRVGVLLLVGALESDKQTPSQICRKSLPLDQSLEGYQSELLLSEVEPITIGGGMTGKTLTSRSAFKIS